VGVFYWSIGAFALFVATNNSHVGTIGSESIDALVRVIACSTELRLLSHLLLSEIVVTVRPSVCTSESNSVLLSLFSSVHLRCIFVDAHTTVLMIGVLHL